MKLPENGLTSLGNRCVIDANTLLDSCFVDGLAHAALRAAATLDLEVILDESIKSEALRKLEELKATHGFITDLCATLKAHIEEQGFEASHCAQLQDRVVNAQDRHVYSAAVQNDAWVLTSDLPLIIQLRSANVEARTAHDLIKTAGLYGDALGTMRFSGLHPQKGSFFVRGYFAGMRELFFSKDFMSLYFDDENSRAGFKLYGIGEVTVPFKQSNQSLVSICGSYNFEVPERRGMLRVMTHKEGQDPKIQGEPIEKHIKSVGRPQNPISFLHSGARAHVVAAATGPNPMSKSMWRNLCELNAVPNPYDQDGLLRALQILEITKEIPAMTIDPKTGNLSLPV